MFEKDINNSDVPKTHPRYLSLKFRHKIIEGMKNLVVAEAGLIAHGRGESFDYILGEKTNAAAQKAIKVAVAALLLAKCPVISVNGNVAALVPDELVKLSKLINAPLEINLFYRKEGRIEAIKRILENSGAINLLGINDNEMVELEGLESNRRRVSVKGIKTSDLVMVPLEDGDRTEALKKLGKNVIAIDLNPVSRTSLWADITIVDNIVRALPEMIKLAEEMKTFEEKQLKQIVKDFNNKTNIIFALDLIKDYIETQKR
ncbi:MAG TPA: 4-phosphopantoate--beta-alanine ligase, partial [Candidatus Lokiarchaeia archaeon]